MALGWNTLQFRRSLTSEATATNVPFNTKDIMHPYSIYHGINLATSGAGKSFSIKNIIEQVMLRYPQDEIIVLDPQRRI